MKQPEFETILTIRTGNIFDSEAQALVNPVNCVGVMGKGLALEFKRRFPDNYAFYRGLCERGPPLTVGWPAFFGRTDGIFIVNFPTKNHWRDPSRIEWIRKGLDGMIAEIHDYDIRSIAFPLLGCGLGGLDERDVVPLIVDFAEAVPGVRVELYVDNGGNGH